MIYDLVKNIRLYPFGPAWGKAVSFLESVNQECPDGIYDIDGRDVYADVSTYSTVAPGAALMEAHRKYADIQIVLSGAETVHASPLASLKARDAYSELKDVVFFDPPDSPAVEIALLPGSFTAFFPEDAHMPRLNRGCEAGKVKKIVFKIKCELLRPA